MHLAYIDDSQDERLAVYSALVIPATQWSDAWSHVRLLRRDLRQRYGILARKELHATDFLAGRGRPSMRTLFKSTRATIFREVLLSIAQLPGARVMSAALARGRKNWAFERLLNRLNVFAQKQDSCIIAICDSGDAAFMRRTLRRMLVYNPVPSAYGTWDSTGQGWKNLPLTHFVEDPVFRDSTESYFIQLADFIAFALLRYENPAPHMQQYGLVDAYTLLDSILIRDASPGDPQGRGIIR